MVDIHGHDPAWAALDAHETLGDRRGAWMSLRGRELGLDGPPESGRPPV
jgi:hypothetical protein